MFSSVRGPEPGGSPGIRNFTERNFSFTIPDGWQDFDIKGINKDVTLALISAREKGVMYIVAENSPELSSIDISNLLVINQAQIKSAVPGVKFEQQQSEIVNGMPGIVFSLFNKSEQAQYTVWVYKKGRYAYQLFHVSRGSSMGEARSDALRMFSGFRMINPAADDTNPAGEHIAYVSGENGYGINLEKTKWRRIADLGTRHQECETGGEHPADACFTITAFSFPFKAPSPVLLLDAVAGYRSFEKVTVSAVAAGLFDCAEMRAFGKSGNDMLFFYSRVHSMGNAVWIFDYFVSATNNLRESLLKEALGGYTVSGRPAPPDPPRDIRAKKALQYHALALGDHFRKKAEHALAYRYMVAAFNAQQERTILLLLLQTCNTPGLYDKGLSTIAGLDRQTAGAPEILSWKALFLLRLNREQEALGLYRNIFSTPYRNDEDMTFFIQLLEKSDREAEAAAVLERYLNQESVSSLWITYAGILHGLGKNRQAETILRRLKKNTIYTPTIGLGLIQVHIALGEYDKALVELQELIKKTGRSATLLHRKGILETKLKQYAAARKSLNEAMTLEPGNEEIRQSIRELDRVAGGRSL